MTERDDISSADDAAWALADGTSPQTENASPQTAPIDNRSRIDQLLREKQTAEAVAQRNLAQAASMRAEAQPLGRAQDYRNPDDYTRAVAQQAVHEAGAELLSRQAAHAQEAATRASHEVWSASTAQFRTRVPDFDQVAHHPDLPVTPIMADAIRESARGAEIAYFLGKNPNEAAQIASLPPLSQATAIARLESRIAPSNVSVSKAPPPVTTLSGRGGTGGRRLEDMSFEDYRRARGY